MIVRTARVLGFGVLLALAGLTMPMVSSSSAVGLAAQDGRSWRLESFHADIQVYESGTVEVTETLRPSFRGQYNGIYRTIPIEYRTPRGFRFKLRLSVESVTDEAGNDLRYETSRDGDDLEIKIWVPNARDAARTVLLTYRVANGIRFFDPDDERDEIVEAYDELYWNVTGTEWPVPIGRASATIRLPVDATGIRAQAFTGPYGSPAQDATVEIEGSLVRIESSRRLDFREGLTAGVAWDAGVVTRPGPIARLSSYMIANWPLLLPFFAFAFMYRRWNERGRDPELGSIEPRYEPPAGLSPAEVGVIIDNTADMRDITATLVDLAVRGYLTIEEEEEEKLMGLLSSKDYVFRRTDKRGTPSAPHEAALLRAVFGKRDSRRLSKLKNTFYKKLPDLKNDLQRALIEHGVYEESPAGVTGKYVGLGVLMGVVIFFGGSVAGRSLHLAPLAVVLSAIISALVIIGFAFIMPARTKRGSELLRQVKGFEEFLERVESDRFKRMITGPEMFEKFLPYAMALGVDSQWAGAFEGMYQEPPDWYRGARFSTFNSRIFVSSLGDLTTQTHSTMSSAPRSSGGSSFGGGGGFSGGGFSGGGFGGGGGGAF